MIIKETLYNRCLNFIDERLITVNKTISDIQNSLQSETKSSAGDKHETGRAMLQLEREKAGHQLAEIEKHKHILQKINIYTKHQKVTLGSVVITTQANYFIAVSAGEIIVDNTVYFAISASTPIAQLLLSKSVDDEIVFRGNGFRILSVL
ncbi:3-oxoacyl-ACP synthase [Winogradskyella psychrotolerans]|uniref:3-oxoacyl-ACP synthase n=1 Tax=Winogradskyella psychrotolerans TaxID=1344585 RepID=UPI001C06F11D|nr:3-oxoacyl-ACP synthase [Winogradskyella psychrotolerans]MBU2921530.1 3-oxoacyl-ACP synthase [Winogradskyella psychrotolerans]